ncbi:MAG: hypothetical protein ACRCU5_12120 [Rhizobiaceae bacterium]
MSDERWFACFKGYLAAVVAVLIGSFLVSCLQMFVWNGSLDLGLTWDEFSLAFTAAGMMLAIGTVPVWLVIALYSESYTRRSLVWHIAAGSIGAAMMTLLIFVLTENAKSSEPSEVVDVLGRLAGWTAIGAIGGFAYWRVAGRNAGLWRQPPTTEATL